MGELVLFAYEWKLISIIKTMQKPSFHGKVQSNSKKAYCNVNRSMRLNLINRYKGIRYPLLLLPYKEIPQNYPIPLQGSLLLKLNFYWISQQISQEISSEGQISADDELSVEDLMKKLKSI